MKKYLTLASLLIIGCSAQVDIEREKETILKINEEQRTAHMTNNAALLVRSIADSLLTLDSGLIDINTNKEVKERFTNYFSNVKYFEWDDLQEPIIHMSEDGSMATMSVRKRTITEYQGGSKDTTIFAWTSAFKKVENEWKMYSITSTDNR